MSNRLKWLFFAAILLLITGGLVTHFTAQKEEFHLRIGEMKAPASSSHSSLQLIDFQIIEKDLEDNILNFSAQLRVQDDDGFWKGEVRANRMLWHRSYHIFLQAADKDLRGCTLLFTHNPVGLVLVYLSYLLFFIGIVGIFISQQGPFRRLIQNIGKPSHHGISQRVAFISTLVTALALFVYLCYRSITMGHNPFRGLHETLLLMALGILFVGLFASRKSPLMAYLSLPMAGIAILVGFMMGGPSASPMPAILQSPWLPFHVSLIMMAYSLFAFTLIISTICIILIISNIKTEKIQQLTHTSQICGLLGVALLAIGIMVGSVWASMSWGSYWDWDPKETWALVTLMAYGLALSLSFRPRFQAKPLSYHLLLVLSFCILLMTYFGVNFWWGGKHAY